VEDALREHEHLLSESQRIAHIGGWSVDVTGTHHWTDGTYRIYGVSPGTYTPTLETLLNLIDPEDQPLMQCRHIELLLNSVGEGLCGLDLNGRVTFLNPAGARILGYTIEELVGRSMHAQRIGAPNQRPLPRNGSPSFAAFGDGEVHHERDWVMWRKDGTWVSVEYTSNPILDEHGELIGTMVAFRDITERRQHERLALRSQRLQAIGTLVSGVAHDLNNALAPIMMGAELLRRQYPKEANIVDVLEVSAKRCADMVRQLVGFAKGVEGERVALQPSYLVKEVEKIMKGSFPKNLQLVIKCDPNLPSVLGDATLLHQVLLNLCVNARDAMPEGGTLSVVAESRNVDAAYASSIPDAKPGKYLVLQVSDTGTGIAPEIVDRIFEPFFTTKGPDKGTGLGLSTVMGIVKGHGGFLHVYSKLEQGSSFAVYLPTEDAGSDSESASPPAVEFRGQGETLLLVDDEPAIREVARAVLGRLNFKLVIATDGSDVLIQVAKHRSELRAIITDLHMPNMDGLTFVRTVRGILPDIPIMVISGRMEEAVAEEFKTLGVTSRLDKPFTEAQLTRMLTSLLQ
jgi:PAS domain S-box-containing protein